MLSRGNWRVFLSVHNDDSTASDRDGDLVIQDSEEIVDTAVSDFSLPRRKVLQRAIDMNSIALLTGWRAHLVQIHFLVC